MTGLEIGLAMALGLVAVFGALVILGACIEQEGLVKSRDIALVERDDAKASADFWRRCLDNRSRLFRELDHKVGAAIVRIIGAHSETCVKASEKRSDPSTYYGKEYDFRAAGMREALNILEQETDRIRDERPPEPPHRPPTEPCIVCGKPACTYRWGQCTTYFRFLLPGDEPRTTAVTREQDFDPNISTGWLPLCSTDAFILDDHGNVTCPARLKHKGLRPC